MSAPAVDERLVTVVLCDGSGAVLGELDPIVARPQFWPDVDEVVRGVRTRDGLDVTVLRLLTTTSGYAGGQVSYLAEVTSGTPARLRPPLEARAAAVTSDPAHRLWWAEPGWLGDLDRWLDDALATAGRTRTGPLRQRKTWNLSLLATVPTSRGEVWFKAVPPFLADEAGVVARVGRVDPELVPRIIAHDPARRGILMDRVSGEDQWLVAREPGHDAVIAAMVTRWVRVQAALADDVEHALALGAVDLRQAALLHTSAELADRPSIREGLEDPERQALDAVVGALPARFAALAECGLPDTLVHGDLHPGNWRLDGHRLTLLDWGDVAVGSPVLDLRAFVERIQDTSVRERAVDVWTRTWREQVPESDPARAVTLVRPLAELAAAVTYQRFLDHIEQTERVYHARDPVDRVRAALRAATTKETR